MKFLTLFVFFTLLHLVACKQDRIDCIANNDVKLLPAKEGNGAMSKKKSGKAMMNQKG